MKKITVLLLSVAFLFSLFAYASGVSADGMQVKLLRDGEETVFRVVSTENGIVSLSKNGDNLIAKTVKGTDPWIDVSLPDIDTWVYDTFIIKYKASGAVYDNGVYLKGKDVNTVYSAEDGTYAVHGFTADGSWHNKSYLISSSFPAMANTKLTGVRIPVCAAAGDTFEIESVTFKSSAYFTSTDAIPSQPGRVFSGWYKDASFTSVASSGPAFAKFVDKNVHKVKWQKKPGDDPDKTDIRLVTTIDSLDYKKAGFQITYGGKTADVATTKAFKNLKAAGEGISPSVFSDQSRYFVSFVITDVPNDALDKPFSVKAYWVTPGENGDTVFGDSLTFYINEPDDASVRTVRPGAGETVSLLTDEMTNWVNNFRPMELDSICDYTEKCEPLPVMLKWDNDDGVLYTHVLISQNEDMSDPDIYLCFENSLTVKDLFSGTTYYWQLRKEYKDKVRISKVNSFETLAAPRTVSLDGVSNVRDIGGYYSEDGKYRIKQGMVYRGADFAHITADGIDKAVNILGIKTEIDLRAADVAGASPLGKKVKYVSVTAPWYTKVWDEPERDGDLLTALRVFTKAENYPVYFHCSLGRDRTGTIAFFLEALCGVSENDIVMDYEVSFFSDFGGYDTTSIPSNYTRDGLKATFYRLRQETGMNSLYKAVRACLKSKGMTDAELDAIRANLLSEVR